MPANLPPQYHEVERKFREAKSPEEKLGFLREMLAVLPKHKGTEKLQADLKRRISKLQVEAQRSRRAGRRPYAFNVEREGAAQIALLGPANSGKSSILRGLTRAEPEVASYPFTTRRPLPGMMHFEDIQMQLVDLPAMSEMGMEHWALQIIKNADAALVVLDISSPAVLEDMEMVENELAKRDIYLASHLGAFLPSPAGAIGRPETKEAATRPGVLESRDLPSDVRASAAPASHSGEEPQQGPASPPPSSTLKKALVVANKADLGVEPDALELLEAALEARPAYLGPLKVITFSATNPESTPGLGRSIFEMAGIIRVYTKIPGKKPDLDRPFVLPLGSTLMDVAALVHKDFVASLKFARIWGSGAFEGQCVQRDHVLKDKDVVELHI